MNSKYIPQYGDVIVYQFIQRFYGGRVPINRAPKLIGTVVGIEKRRRKLFWTDTIIKVKGKYSKWNESPKEINLNKGEYAVKLYDTKKPPIKVMEKQKELSIINMRNSIRIGDIVSVDMWRQFDINENWDGEVVEIYKTTCSSEEISVKFNDRHNLPLPNPMSIGIENVAGIIKGESWTDENKKIFEKIINGY